MKKIDYKKEYRGLYLPKQEPMLINVPKITYVTVCGKGDPNTCEEYKEAIELLYGISYTIKMSKMTDDKIDGYFEYVVPPLEGLWWLDKKPEDLFISDKNKFYWKAMIRLPEFVTVNVFEIAKNKLKIKKPNLDINKINYEEIEEGKCVQIMHIGSYDSEVTSIKKIYDFIDENGLEIDINDCRLHHEIYLSDPRKTKVENLKTVIRYPVK
ncbi:GyrI-like domain-containing protein [Thomasclavelia cocleata]|uniref:GyrI-like domain-containing protein n=1 Tax=Thomasclavelia cocleata TaxID=69824 RepID=UPI00242DE9F5|nr:GyrI-like domain-containing protein [Thomasclavelia cocleata]